MILLELLSRCGLTSEVILTLGFPTRFHDEVSWAFKMFDIDNSGLIMVEEIHESVKVGVTLKDVELG